MMEPKWEKKSSGEVRVCSCLGEEKSIRPDDMELKYGCIIHSAQLRVQTNVRIRIHSKVPSHRI